MKTVIQKIGPLYGEPINGSVFGQPNGSEAIPKQNKIYVLTDYPNYHYIKNNVAPIVSCNSSGKIGSFAVMAIEVQFSGKYSLKTEISNSSTFSNILTSVTASGSDYYGSSTKEIYLVGTSADLTVVAGTTYYLRVSVIYDGQVVCTSDSIEVEGYA